MIKYHDLKTVVIDGNAYCYFFTRERNDVNGNPRFRVYIIDPEAPTVYEKIFKCYENQISERVKMFVEAAQC